MDRNASVTWSNVAYPQFPENFIVNGGVLIIRDAKIEHSGIYTCTSRVSMPDGTEETIMEWAGVYIAVNKFNIGTTDETADLSEDTLSEFSEHLSVDQTDFDMQL